MLGASAKPLRPAGHRLALTPAARLLRGTLILLLFAGCRSYSTIETPITDGYHAKLPSPYTRAVVWGTRSDTVQSVSTWLLKKGILVVDQAKLMQVAADQKVSITGYQYVETDVLRTAKLVGARLVVFANAEVGSWEVLGRDGVIPRNMKVYSGTISLRAVDVNTGEIEWSGKAQSSDRFNNLEEGISQLSCHALATAWGLRNPGHTSPEHVCPARSGVMAYDASSSKNPPQTATPNPPASPSLQSN
jgi:carbonic anhydrase/acetyltransferase-like protein (isoleucine patch superfamily)